VACRVTKEDGRNIYTIPADATPRDAGGRVLPSSPELQAWWTNLRQRRDETLLIRQESVNPKMNANVVELTLGQTYDLIHALCWAVMKP
jgi:hypothetical protein